MWKRSEHVTIHEGDGRLDILMGERFRDSGRTRHSGQARQAFQQNRVLVDTTDFREAATRVDAGLDRACWIGFSVGHLETPPEGGETSARLYCKA